MNEFISLGVSVMALGIAVYGIFERQRAAYAASRVRLTELLEEIEKQNVEEDRFDMEAGGRDDDQPPQPAVDRSWVGSFVSRRALLTYQALALLDGLLPRWRVWMGRDLRITASEHVCLASSLEVLGDVVNAREQWDNAVLAVDAASPGVLAAAHRGLAHNCLAQGELDRARTAFLAAAAHERRASGPMAWWGEFQTYLDWVRAERDRFEAGHPGAAEAAAEPATHARDLSEAHPEWKPWMLAELARAAHTTIRDQHSGEFGDAWVGLPEPTVPAA